MSVWHLALKLLILGVQVILPMHVSSKLIKGGHNIISPVKTILMMFGWWATTGG